MYEFSKQFLDKRIGRRTFIRRLAQGGMSLTGANAIANNLGQPALPANGAAVEAGTVLRNLTGGEVMAEFIKEWNIPYVFGLAGSEEVGFLDALVDRPELQYTTCLHENAAMAMADGFSRSTGQTSIVQLHSVAGVAYALGQIASSYRDRIPVVVTAGRQSTNFRGQGGFLESPNLTELPRDYAQWVWDVMSPETIPEVLRRAFLLAEAPPGGPTFITFSKDLWEQRVDTAEIIPRSRSRTNSDVPPPDGFVERTVDMLLNAQKPVLFLGNECIRHEISEEVAGIAEAVGAMVMFSVKIPCVFPNTHPHFVGEVQDDPAILSDVDCFWSIGGHMFKTFNRPANPIIARSAKVIHTSLVEADVGRNYPVDLAAIASIKSSTELVLQELSKHNLKTSAIRARKQWLSEYSGKRQRMLKELAEKEWNKTPIATSRLMSELNEVIDRKAEIVSELITSDSYPRKYLQFDHTVPAAERRRQYYTTSGVLGWGVAAAVGTKIGNPDKEVWCLTGDGSFNFGSQALWSAARYEVPIGIVIFNNGQYQANRFNQNKYKGRMVETGKYIGVNLGHPDIDYRKMAAAYGIEGERVSDPKKLSGALKRCKRAINDGRPYLVDVKIEKRSTGKESDWYDFYSVAQKIPRQS
ncbi:MAG: thiamine pyrophosphate-binding protein [Gammaproteobacteria bacterium]|nr:thiamine pyrophosphate-binding protein [Gammaproteobacteria bacterium]